MRPNAFFRFSMYVTWDGVSRTFMMESSVYMCCDFRGKGEGVGVVVACGSDAKNQKRFNELLSQISSVACGHKTV